MRACRRCPPAWETPSWRCSASRPRSGSATCGSSVRTRSSAASSKNAAKPTTTSTTCARAAPSSAPARRAGLRLSKQTIVAHRAYGAERLALLELRHAAFDVGRVFHQDALLAGQRQQGGLHHVEAFVGDVEALDREVDALVEHAQA